MKRIKDAKALLADANEMLKQLRKLYESSWSDQQIDCKLPVRTKCYVEHLRSVLDYCARELHERFVGTQKEKIYFPIAKRESDPKNFANIINSNLSGLIAKKPEAVDFLAQFQVFSNPLNTWLCDLATICNENKHNELSCQENVKVPALLIRGKAKIPRARQKYPCARSITLQAGATINLQRHADPLHAEQLLIAKGGRVIMERNTLVWVGGTRIMGPQTLSYASPPKKTKLIGRPEIRFVELNEIRFAGIDVDAYFLLQRSLSGVETILNAVIDFIKANEAEKPS